MEAGLFYKVITDLDNENRIFPGYHLVYDHGAPVLLGRGADSNVFEVVGEGNEKYALKIIESDDLEDLEEKIRLQKLFMNYEKIVVDVYEYKQIVIPEERYGKKISLQFVLMEKVMPVLTVDSNGTIRFTREEFSGLDMIAKMAHDISAGMMYLHYDNVLHRDIKLENIFWCEEEGNPGESLGIHFILGDFGSARELKNGEGAETVIYTDGYGAPEVKVGIADSYSFAADQYSFGMMIYLLLNGLKFPGSDGYTSNHAIQYNENFVFPNPEIHIKSVTEILRKACSFNPEDRYPTMEQLHNELDDAFMKYTDNLLSAENEKETEVNASERYDTVTETYIEESDQNLKKKPDKELKLSGAWMLKNDFIRRLPKLKNYRAEAQTRYYVYREKQSLFIIPLALLSFLVMIGFGAELSAYDGYAVLIMAVLLILESGLHYVKRLKYFAGAVIIGFSAFLMIKTGVIAPYIIVISGVWLDHGDISLGFGIGTMALIITSGKSLPAFMEFISNTPVKIAVLILMVVVVFLYLLRAFRYGAKKRDFERAFGKPN